MQHTYLLKVLSILMLSGLIASQAMARDPFWDNAKHSCKGSKGVVKAKLKKAKFGKKKKTCENEPPAFSALGASGEPDRCKRKPDTSVWGEWDIPNDARCASGDDRQKVRWDKAVHKCIAPGKGRVKARLKGEKFGKRLKTCRNSPPSFDSLGASGSPNYCKTQATGSIYGYWEIDDDARCEPAWGRVEAKGCMGPPLNNPDGPNRQVYRAKLKKLKRHAEQTKMEWENGKWIPFYESKAYKRQQCTDTEGPDNRGKPDFCKVKSGIWAYWYEDTQQCEKPLEWGRIRDKGCVKDMKEPDANLQISLEGKRSYHAKLKHVAGNWLEACQTSGIDASKGGNELNFQNPTNCYLRTASGGISLGLGTVFGAAGSVVSGPVGGAAFGFVTTAASNAAMSAMDTSTSVHGVFWVDDESCGTVEDYPAADNSGQVLLSTGEISTRIASNNPGRSPIRLPGTQPAMAWGRWDSNRCQNGNRVWASQITNTPNNMDWKNVCRNAIQLPYTRGQYPSALTDRLNSGNPQVGYPDRCTLDRSSSMIVGEFHIQDRSCN